jgi:hypothetical protein
MHPHAVFVLVRIEELGVVRVRESELPHAAGIGVGVDVLELDLIATLAADLGQQIVHVGVHRPELVLDGVEFLPNVGEPHGRGVTYISPVLEREKKWSQN